MFDSRTFALSLNIDHQTLVGQLNSLASEDYIKLEAKEAKIWVRIL